MSLMTALKTQADAPVLLDHAADAADVDTEYRYWRSRILLTTIVGYAMYYFVRSNISLPLKAMGAELHYSKAQLGLITTIGGVTYGVSKFINGFLGDHANPRYFMAIGLFGCALMNVFFGLSSSLVFFATFWFFNNYAQGMGFPPCAKSMAHWFSPRERSTTFGIWHTSHMIGAALVGALTGYLVKYLGWRSCFFIPAGLATMGAVYILIYLRDTPGSMGLPPVEVYKGEETPEQLAEELKEPVAVPVATRDAPQAPSLAPGMTAAEVRATTLDYAAPDATLTYWQIVWKYIFLNPYMWIISFANLSVYVLRYAQMTWGPTFLQEYKGLSVVTSGWLYFGAEIGGMFGALVAGFTADRLFNGRAGRVCVIAMALMAATIYTFWHAPRSMPVLAGTLYVLMGFFLYIPQMLIAAMAMNLGTKRASAAAVGLTGIIGYGSTIITGFGIGHLVDNHGWPAAFKLMLVCSLITLALMAITWNVGAHPQRETTH
jgi:OPA family glycerol-3-phosphate transporter-like MFS transporter/OPA family sugar phosphate sensor protein UhpC-like MFS transporter